MRLSFFLREAMRSLRRSALPSFAALATVLVTMLVLGVFIPIVQATTGAANEVRGRLLLDVYLKTDAKPADIQRVKALVSNTPHVKRIQFVSKAQAYRDERRRNPQAYQLLGSNPLPDTFRVTPDHANNLNRVRDAIMPVGATGRRAPADPAIDEVKNRRDETNKILSATRIVKLTMALLAALLIAASILLISNTIKLSLFSRRREVEVMKLVGATDWFIRWPFVIEGVIVGLAGGVLAIVVLAVAKIALLDPLFSGWSLIAQIRTIAFPALIAVMLAASVAVSAIGSGLSLRRFLRV